MMFFCKLNLSLEWWIVWVWITFSDVSSFNFLKLYLLIFRWMTMISFLCNDERKYLLYFLWWWLYVMESIIQKSWLCDKRKKSSNGMQSFKEITLHFFIVQLILHELCIELQNIKSYHWETTRYKSSQNYASSNFLGTS